MRQPAPIVFANFERDDHSFPQVYIDNAAAGTAAARHLLMRGYARLFYFQPFAATWSDERLAGVRSVLGASAAEPARLRVLPDRPDPAEIPNQHELAHDRAREVLASDAWAPHTGVIAVNDYAAEEFARAARPRPSGAGADGTRSAAGVTERSGPEQAPSAPTEGAPSGGLAQPKGGIVTMEQS